MAASDLAGRAIRGVRWNYLGAVGRIVATFLSQIVLARLLGPEQFGLFGYAFLTVSLLALLVEMGLQNALVQVAELGDDVLAIACARLLLMGALVATGVFVFADLIALHVFHAPAAAPVLQAMAPTLVVGAANVAATAMLTREIDFKAIQIAALGSYVVGYLVVGIGAAMLDLGVWSLVLAWHVQTVLACLVMIVKSPRSLRLGNPFRRLPVARFGLVVMATHMSTWLIDNGPHTAIGRWLGASTLGLYTVANNLVKVAADHLVRNIQTVLHALVSRAQGNDAGLRRAYLTVVAGVGVLAFPVFTFVALMSEPVVEMLLGPKWKAAATVLLPLSLAMILHALEGLAGPTLSGMGEPGVELRVKLVMLVASVAVLVVTAHWSLAAVGWGVAAVYLVRWLWMNAAVMRRLAIPVDLLGRALGGSLLLAFLAWAVPTAVMAGLDAWPVELPAAALVAITATPTALVMIGLTLIVPRWILGPFLLALVHGLFEKRPGLAARAALRRVAAGAAHAAAEVASLSRGASTPWTRLPKTS